MVGVTRSVGSRWQLIIQPSPLALRLLSYFSNLTFAQLLILYEQFGKSLFMEILSEGSACGGGYHFSHNCFKENLLFSKSQFYNY